jgi:hypothetical protein
LGYRSIAYFPLDGFAFDFDEQTRVVVKPLKETLKAVDGPHWEKWVGTLAWKDVSESRVQGTSSFRPTLSNFAWLS